LAGVEPLRGFDAPRHGLDTILIRHERHFHRADPEGLVRRSRRLSASGGDSMGDVIYIGLTLAFFGLSWAFVVLCERL
jgi:hypothetical protein